MTKKTRRAILFALRLGLCVAALAYVIKDLSWIDYAYPKADSTAIRYPIVLEESQANGDGFRYVDRDGTEVSTTREAFESAGGRVQVGLQSTVRRANKRLLLLSLLIFLPAPFLASLRLVWMLQAQEISLTWWEATKLTFAGNFFNFAIPGTTGGDVFKAYYIAQHTDRKTEAVTTVFLDRAVGLFGLCILGGVAILFRLDDPELRRLGIKLIILLGVLVSGATLFFSHRLRALFRVDAILDRLPLKEQVHRVDRATFRMRHHKTHVLIALVLTGLVQGFALGSFAAAGKAMGMTQSIPFFYAGLAMGLLIAAIPLTPMSAGTMEAIFAWIFSRAGASVSQALFLALAVRVVQLIYALPGVLVPLTGAHRPSPDKLAELEARMASDSAPG